MLNVASNCAHTKPEAVLAAEMLKLLTLTYRAHNVAEPPKRKR